MSEMKTQYSPKEVEEKWSAVWERQGIFSAEIDSEKEPFSIIMPPPNVTGQLHMGHALVSTLQDILIRYKRMQGYAVLWQPGVDHAGIATQSVVERHLIATEGKRRSDYSREVFLQHIWEWKDRNEDTIVNQMKRLGASADWNRKRFTMDQPSNKAVKMAFQKMFNEGLIYRGDYLVNWDPVTQTALADDEVEYEDQNGALWYFKYPLEKSEETITIATTRPETMLGDVAVAVHPKDERYAHLIGKKILLPITHRSIEIIADPFVKKEFGTGAVKITPAHDPNDYEMALRHDLPMINIMNPDATINEVGGAYEHMGVEEAREAIVQRMRELNLLEKIEPHDLRVGTSYRSKAIIQPRLSKQWFIRMEPFKKQLIKAIEDDHIEVIPALWKKTYFHWIENLRDWCISRQLWWGHRIPIWYNVDDGRMICHVDEDLPKEAREHPDKWVQDEDVLDTWFSSALWPFSSLGWPEDTEHFNAFYPTSVLITGHDILFFWVARMILMGEYIAGDVPFQKAYIHGLIFSKSYWREDKEGQIHYLTAQEKQPYELGESVPEGIHSKWEKMSKSKLNVINPLEIIELYGADAMRMTLCRSVSDSRQIDLDRRLFEEFRNFSNKMWNAARFITMNLDETFTHEVFAEGLDSSILTLDDYWLLSRLEKTIEEATRHLETFKFNDYAKVCYTFFWDELCAYYLEISKPYLFGRAGDEKIRASKRRLLVIALSHSIALLHPVLPFITEEIFAALIEKIENLSKQKSEEPYTNSALQILSAPCCALASYPKTIDDSSQNQEIEKAFEQTIEIVHAIRNIRAERGIPPGMSIDITLQGENISADQKNIIESLTRILNLSVVSKGTAIDLPLASKAVLSSHTLWIPLPPDLKEQERRRLEKEVEKLTKQHAGLATKLSNEAFIARAPQHLVEETQKLHKELQEKLEETRAALAKLQERS